MALVFWIGITLAATFWRIQSSREPDSKWKRKEQAVGAAYHFTTLSVIAPLLYLGVLLAINNWLQ